MTQNKQAFDLRLPKHEEWHGIQTEANKQQTAKNDFDFRLPRSEAGAKHKTESFAFFKAHKKYFVLFAIFYIFLVLSQNYDPWEERRAAGYLLSDNKTQAYETYSPERSFYKEYFGEEIEEELMGRLLCFGVPDLLNVFEISEGSPKYSAAMAIFPLVMIVKTLLMKRYFSRKKDCLETKSRKLYYRSENILCDFAADNTAFYISGLLIKGVTVFNIAADDISNTALRGISYFLYNILLIPGYCVFRVCKVIMDEYAVPDLFGNAGISAIVLSIAFLLVVEIALRLMLIPIIVVYERLRKAYRIYIRRRAREKRRMNTQSNNERNNN